MSKDSFPLDNVPTNHDDGIVYLGTRPSSLDNLLCLSTELLHSLLGDVAVEGRGQLPDLCVTNVDDTGLRVELASIYFFPLGGSPAEVL